LVIGCLEFQQYKQQLDDIDEQLITFDMEKELIKKSLLRLEKELGSSLSENRFSTLIKHHSIALRCTIARRLLGSSFRQFHVELSQSFILQGFVGILNIDTVRIPSKSQLERYEKFFSQQDIDFVILEHVDRVFDEEMNIETPDGYETVSPERVYADSTCLPANIHHPVDWVLLKDASLSLLKTIVTVRKRGVRHRIANPRKLMRQVNLLSIRMSHARRHQGAKKKRKAVFREMKKLLKRIATHGLRYLDLIRTRWFDYDLTQNEAQLFCYRLEGIIDRVAHVIWQAHERVIGERPVANKEKLLSLYEDNVHVIVRGKAGAEVEFGNGLYLAEQQQGLILDWKLYRDQPPSDSKNVSESIERMENAYGYGSVHLYCGDRGFDSKKNIAYLSTKKIFNSLCPRNPLEHEIMQEYKVFRQSQRRRAQTEARISIFRNIFLDKVIRSKGFKNRSLTVSWSVLTHNLWLVSRLKARKRQIEQAA